MQNSLVRPISVTVNRVQRELEETTENIQDEVDDHADKEEKTNLVAAAANAGRRRFETVERSEQNTGLVNFCEQRAESQRVEETSLDVLEALKKIAKENDAMIARMDYRTVATDYGYAYTNDSYRVMEGWPSVSLA